MLDFKTVSRKTYDRNIKSGKWAKLSEADEYRGMIKTTSATRGVYNGAGRVFCVEFTLDKNNH